MTTITSDHDREGVIQFRLEHTETALGETSSLPPLIAWHAIMYRLGIIGRDPLRYEGYAFGNMSQRMEADRFIISGTQTGGIEHLGDEHYAQVEHCDVSANSVRSSGPVKPSSECMTHAAIYAASIQAGAVVHVHSPAIWQRWQQLGISTTAKDIAYGTPAMAAAVVGCITQADSLTHGSIAMLGHEDGVLTYASDLETAGLEMVRLLSRALALM